jgi:trans-aconitate 3-methyltransferase
MLEIARTTGGKTPAGNTIEVRSGLLPPLSLPTFSTNPASFFLKQQYIETAAETASSALPPSTISLITAANAAHFFDMPSFYASAYRLLTPGGSIALWTTGPASIHPQTPCAETIQALLDKFSAEDMAPYETAANRLVRGRYGDLPLPWTCEPAIEGWDQDRFVRREWGPEEVFHGGQDVKQGLDLDTAEKMFSTSSSVVKWRAEHPELVGTEQDAVRKLVQDMGRVLREEGGVKAGEERLWGISGGVVLILKKAG